MEENLVALAGRVNQLTSNHVAQLYGSYVIPGSTLNDLHLTVS